MENTFWRKCSSCKKELPFLSRYYECSVSTCNQKRTGYVFCSVPCFETHLPSARHKDAAAIEMKAPSFQEAQKESSAASMAPQRRIISSGGPAPALKSAAPREVLIVASKLKDYIRARSEMNTSAQVMDVLSDIVRGLADEAIERARAEGRKTVLDRDFNRRS